MCLRARFLLLAGVVWVSVCLGELLPESALAALSFSPIPCRLARSERSPGPGFSDLPWTTGPWGSPASASPTSRRADPWLFVRAGSWRSSIKSIKHRGKASTCVGTSLGCFGMSWAAKALGGFVGFLFPVQSFEVVGGCRYPRWRLPRADPFGGCLGLLGCSFSWWPAESLRNRSVNLRVKACSYLSMYSMERGIFQGRLTSVVTAWKSQKNS